MATKEKKNQPGVPVSAPRETQKSRYHHGDLRAALIEATRQLVEEQGPDSFSVADACRIAGVSTAAPYKHFADKKEMLVATVLEGMLRHRHNMLTALEDIPEGTPDRITAIGKEYVQFALEEPAIFRLKFGGFTDRVRDEKLTDAGRATFSVLLREIAACIGADETSDDVRRRGFLLWSFVHGLSFILHDKQLAELGGEIDLQAMLEDVSQRMLA